MKEQPFSREKINCCLNPIGTAPNPRPHHNSEAPLSSSEQVWDLVLPDQLVVAPRQQVLPLPGLRPEWTGDWCTPYSLSLWALLDRRGGRVDWGLGQPPLSSGSNEAWKQTRLGSRPAFWPLICHSNL